MRASRLRSRDTRRSRRPTSECAGYARGCRLVPGRSVIARRGQRWPRSARAHWLSHTPSCLARPAGARREVREMVGSAAPPTLALNPQLPRGFGAHSPFPSGVSSHRFWRAGATLLRCSLSSRPAAQGGAARRRRVVTVVPARCACRPRTRRGELCDLCFWVWARTKRAHSQAAMASVYAHRFLQHGTS